MDPVEQRDRFDIQGSPLKNLCTTSFQHGLASDDGFETASNIFKQILATRPRDVTFEIRVCVTRPDLLRAWNLETWAKHSELSIQLFNDFIEKNCQTLANANITAGLYQYDNLPHWHGVLLNREHLFMGRTEWYEDGDDSQWDLRVGEVEYREFHLLDRYGGKARVDRFALWMDRYVARSKEKKWALGCGTSD